MGLHLDDLGESLSWRDLHVVAQQAPPESSAVHRALLGEEKQAWGLSEQLLAMVVDELRVLAWQNTKDATKGRNYPKPLPRPGVTQDEGVKVGSRADALPLDEMAAWLGWPTPN